MSTNKTASRFLMLITFGGFGLWWVADFFFMDFILHRRKARNRMAQT